MEYAVLAMLGIALWFWLDSIRVRELAIAAGQEAAQRYGLQFLDETVALTKLRAGRDGAGRMRLKRTFSFEVSDTGIDRLPCSITMLGNRVDDIDVPPHHDNVVSLFG